MHHIAILLVAAPTILVTPFEGKNELIGDLGVAVQLRALGTLDAMGGLNTIHPKQLNRVAEHHRARLSAMDENAVKKELATILGADWLLSGQLSRTAHDVELAFEVRSPDGAKKAASRVKGATLMDAFGPLSQEIAVQLKKLGVHQGQPDPALITPVTTDEKALTAYAA